MTTAPTAPLVYVVRFWLAPEQEAECIDWIDGGHLQEVVDQPGFLWGQRLTLNEKNEDGWQGYLNLYGVESKGAFETYQNSAIQTKFQEEAGRFAEHMKIDRAVGETGIFVTSRTRAAAAE